VAVSASLITDGGEMWTGGSPRRFFWGSIAKPFAVMTALLLEDEGRLSLSDPISSYGFHLRGGEQISIHDLLDHTSGIANFTALEGFVHDSAYHPPDELIGTVAHKPVDTCGAWAYSNTGYLIAGLAMETAGGRPYHELVGDLVFAQVAPTSLSVLAPDSLGSDLELPAPRGETPNVSIPFAAGALVGTSLDLARAWRAFLQGVIVPESDVRRMFGDLRRTDKPGRSYGLGVMAYRGAAAEGDTRLGHQGSIDGARGVVFWSMKGRAVVAVAVAGPGSAKEIGAELVGCLSDADDG